jgi:thiamine-monophosphate kinase
MNSMTDRPPPSEFELIARYFAPLAARAPGSLGLTDDAALVKPPPGHHHVIAVDTLVQGVHFLADDPPDLIARKLLRVNLSDIASMGAVPKYYLLAISLCPGIGENWLEEFAAGLVADQEEFHVALLGGDTTSTPGPMTLTLTAMGEVPDGGELRRSTARPGDLIYVSGTIGDAALGICVLTGKLSGLSDDMASALADRYRLPRPRVALGPALRGSATAMTDISDGLIADLGHICETSGVGARIGAASVPLSPAAAAAVAHDANALQIALTGGDDYELAFTANPASKNAVDAAARAAGVPVVAVGRITNGTGVELLDENDEVIDLKTVGYTHF